MSHEENFLSRWSRKKRAATEPSQTQEPDAAGDMEQATAAVAPDAPTPDPRDPAPDLANLPPLESIGAGSDISAFLAPGVPVDIARAALRRVWTVDPAIRDFIGLSENSWDFNAPGGVPGFDHVLPPDLAERLLADVLGHKAEAAEGSGRDTSTQAKAETDQRDGLEDMSKDAPAPDSVQIPSPPPKPVEQSKPINEPRSDSYVAMQKDDQSVDNVKLVVIRNHGGALPE